MKKNAAPAQDWIEYENYETVKSFTLRKTGNRPVREDWVKKKISEIYDKKTNSWNMVSPAVVNINTLHVLDAQHRREGWMRLMENHTLPETSRFKVMYIDIPEEEEVNYIRQYNSGNNWRTDTFIKSSADEGNKMCETIIKFSEAHNNIGYRLSATLMTGQRINDLIEKNIEITKDMEDQGDKTYKNLVALLTILGRGTSGMEGMVQAWNEHKDDYIFQEWKSGFKSKKSQINGLLNAGKTPGKRIWENAFDIVSGHINHKAKTNCAEC